MRVSQRTLATSSLLLALITFGLTNPANAAAPKAGAPCTKAGATEIASGKKFTCTKSGKKLTWNKGVAVSSATTSQRDAFAIYGKDAARFKAVDEYGAKLVSSRVKNAPSINSVLQSPADPAVIRMTANAQYAFSVYEQLAPLGFTPKWIVGEDGDWIKDQLKDVAPCLSYLSPNQGGASCRITAVWRGIKVQDDANTRNLMLVQGGHEIFHLYQQEIWRENYAKVPDWIREGSASLGMGIILTHFEDRKSFANYGVAQKVERSARDKSRCEAALNKWENSLDAEGFGNNNGCEYGLGLLMNEYLVMKGHTLNDVLELIKVIGSGTDFPTAFQQVYKISTTDFFTQLRAYLKTLNYGW
jgi:hypothetical protein